MKNILYSSSAKFSIIWLKVRFPSNEWKSPITPEQKKKVKSSCKNPYHNKKWKSCCSKPKLYWSLALKDNKWPGERKRISKQVLGFGSFCFKCSDFLVTRCKILNCNKGLACIILLSIVTAELPLIKSRACKVTGKYWNMWKAHILLWLGKPQIERVNK